MAKTEDINLIIPIHPISGRKHGLSHLLEHVLVKRIKGCVFGATIEDLIFLKCFKTNISNIMRDITSCEVTKEEIERERSNITREIKGYSREGEMFWRKVWKNTVYERGPMGSKTSINRITVNDINHEIREVLKQKLYFIETQSRHLHVINGQRHVRAACESVANNGEIVHNKFKYKGKRYDNIFIKSGKAGIEKYYLFSMIMKNINSDKLIMFSEKMDVSAIILEEGVKYFNRHNVLTYKKETIKKLYEAYMGETGKDSFRVRSFLGNSFHSVGMSKGIKIVKSVTCEELLRIKNALENDLRIIPNSAIIDNSVSINKHSRIHSAK